MGPLGANLETNLEANFGFEIIDFWRILDPQTDPKTSITVPLTGGVKGTAS